MQEGGYGDDSFNTFGVQFNGFPARQSAAFPLTLRLGAALTASAGEGGVSFVALTGTPTLGVSRRIEVTPAVAFHPELSGGATLVVAAVGSGAGVNTIATFGMSGSVVIGTGTTRIALTPAFTSLRGDFRPSLGVSLLMAR